MHENRETSEMPAVNLRRRTAGEGSGRTARVHVCEESDSGIVPMNHSNKDGRLVGGGRGGKAGGAGAHTPPRKVPDIERDCACPTGRRVCGPAARLAVIHLR